MYRPEPHLKDFTVQMTCYSAQMTTKVKLDFTSLDQQTGETVICSVFMVKLAKGSCTELKHRNETENPI